MSRTETDVKGTSRLNVRPSRSPKRPATLTKVSGIGIHGARWRVAVAAAVRISLELIIVSEMM